MESFLFYGRLNQLRHSVDGKFSEIAIKIFSEILSQKNLIKADFWQKTT
jgi:hypothetical protein